MMNERKTIVDISKWQTRVDFAYLLEHGVSGVVIKAGQAEWQDKRFVQHMEGALAAKMPVNVYWWADPFTSVARHISAMRATLCNYRFNTMWLDMEQCGYTYLNLPLIVSPHRLSAWAYDLVLSSQSLFFNELIGVYTRPWFIQERMWPARTWLPTVPQWYATYPTIPVKTCKKKLTWEELFGTVGCVPMQVKIGYPPAYPANLRNPVMWQYSSTHILPGIYGGAAGQSDTTTDLNMWLGSEDLFHLYFNRSGIYVVTQ